jgi:hypothetical protein
MNKRDGSTVLRTSLAAGLIGLGLIAAVMEVQADLTKLETRRRLRRRPAAFETLGDHAVATHCLRVADELATYRKGI